MDEKLEEDFKLQENGCWMLRVGLGSPLAMVILSYAEDMCSLGVINDQSPDVIEYIANFATLEDAKLAGSYITSLHRTVCESRASSPETV